MFTVELGSEVVSKVTGFKGIITSRSENLYGCNRYYIQPKANAEMVVPDGWWVDELDIEVLSQTITRIPSINGGPMSRVC